MQAAKSSLATAKLQQALHQALRRKCLEITPNTEQWQLWAEGVPWFLAESVDCTDLGNVSEPSVMGRL